MVYKCVECKSINLDINIKDRDNSTKDTYCYTYECKNCNKRFCVWKFSEEQPAKFKEISCD